MKQILFALVLVVVTAVVTSSICRRDGASESVYSELVRASTPEEMAAAFEGLQGIKRYAGMVPKDVSRKAFNQMIEYRDKAFGPLHDDDSHIRFEYWTDYLSHLAAISGDVELMRKMTFTYFGSATGEVKGAWIEVFLQYNPELFFSLADTWNLWIHAGGAAWCCDEPEITIPIVKKFVGSTADAQRIFDDLKNTAFISEKETEWAKEARKLLSESE